MIELYVNDLAECFRMETSLNPRKRIVDSDKIGLNGSFVVDERNHVEYSIEILFIGNRTYIQNINIDGYEFKLVIQTDERESEWEVIKEVVKDFNKKMNVLGFYN